jgi:ethanolamine transporter EutH
MSFNSEYVLPMIVGKLVAGICAVVIARIMYAKMNRNT